MGEVAARLGGYSTYRRTGRLIWMWDSININGWQPSGGASFSITSLRRWLSEGSLRLNSGTMSNTFPALYPTLGYEFTISPDTGLLGFYPDYTSIDIYIYKPDGLYLFSIHIYWELLNIAILTPLGYVNILSIAASQHGLWHNVKLTIDTLNPKYGWLYYDASSVLLSSYAPSFGAPIGNEYIGLTIGNNPGVGKDGQSYITNGLLTINESVA